MKTHIIGNQWLGRLLEPSEIAATALFLASDGAAAITGEALWSYWRRISEILKYRLYRTNTKG
ncbi:SDR family oxidoreductase [Niallia sp. Krafla_26]|uniref:SDR family oxidoreductase n=1 Tax=Niallia sp. Krafla_26 TaxID=3064703 RepID=UPI003D17EF4F